MYAPRPTSDLSGRRLCLPFACFCLYPDNAVCRDLLGKGDGPRTIAELSVAGGLRFSTPGGATQGNTPGKYLVLLDRESSRHCVGLSVDSSGMCTWFDSEKPCEFICDVRELPDMEYWYIALVALAEEGSIHMHPRFLKHIDKVQCWRRYF